MTAARMKVCPTCDGYGETGFPEATSVYTRSDGWYPCPRCKGSKQVLMTVEDELAEAQAEIKRLADYLRICVAFVKDAMQHGQIEGDPELTPDGSIRLSHIIAALVPKEPKP